MAQQPPTQSCGNCRYWEQRWDSLEDSIKSGVSGKCQRYPPLPLREREPEDQYDMNADWPSTRPYHWCGEWTPANPETVTDGAAVLARLVLLGDMTAARALVDKIKEGE